MSFPLPPKTRLRKTDFDIQKDIIGHGGLAVVRVAVEKSTGRQVALKEFDRAQLRSAKKEDDVTMEEHCLRRANHPGIIKVYASFRDEECHYFALELCPGGELWNIVKGVGCPETLATHYLAQVFDAISYLRDAQIVHRDIKAENVLISSSGTCKLIDFGCAKDLANPHIKGAGTYGWKKTMEDYVGTPNFMAPEVVNNKASNFKSDTWSLGCLIFQVLVGVPPFYGGSICRVYRKILKQRLWLPQEGLSAQARDLMLRMVVKDPDKRLGGSDIGEIERHQFFNGKSFKNAHRRPIPVLSLGQLCTSYIGRRWSIFKERVLQMLMMADQNQLLHEDTRSTLMRLAEIAELLDGKANEGTTSSSSEASQEDKSK